MGEKRKIKEERIGFLILIGDHAGYVQAEFIFIVVKMIDVVNVRAIH